MLVGCSVVTFKWSFAAHAVDVWIFGVSYLSAVDHTACPHEHTALPLRNVSHVHLIGCLVCFVWGASEEGLALWLMAFVEYTSLSSWLTHPHPVTPSSTPSSFSPCRIFFLHFSLEVNWGTITWVTSSVFHTAPFRSSGKALNILMGLWLARGLFFFHKHPITRSSPNQEESCYLVPRPTSCSTRTPDP